MFFFAEVGHQFDLMALLDWKTNVINWILLVIALIYGWIKIVPPMLEQRARQIKDSIDSAKTEREEARTFLSEQETRIDNAQKEADKIVEEAKEVAAQMKAEIEAQTEAEIDNLHEKLSAALANERQLVITEMRAAAARAAISLSQQYLEKSVSDADKQKLLAQFMQQLDTMGTTGESFAPGTDKVESVL